MRLVKSLIPSFCQTILCNVSNPLCWLTCRNATLTSFAKQFVFISQQPIISAFEDRMTILCVTRKTPVLKEKLPFYFHTSQASHAILPIRFWFELFLPYVFGFFFISICCGCLAFLKQFGREMS